MAERNPLVVSMIRALKHADSEGRYVPVYLHWHNPQSVLAVPADPSHRRDLIQGALQQVTRDTWFTSGPNPRCYLPKVKGQHWKNYYGPGVAAAWAGIHKDLHDKSFGDVLLEGVIAVTDNPIFKAVIGIATAAIPGVGAVLAPLAVALETAVTNLVKKAHEGHVDAGDVLSNAANVAVSSAGALGAASPALKSAINTGRTTYERVKETASQVTAIARASTQVDLVHELTAARSLLLRAKHGDKAAHAQLAHISRCARAGQPAAIKVLALATAVAHGIKHGHVPHATKHEIASFKRGIPLPKHLAYYSAPHLRHPFLVPKGHHTIGVHPAAHLSIHAQAAYADSYHEHDDGSVSTDGSMHYGTGPAPRGYNEANAGSEHQEPGDYDAEGLGDDPRETDYAGEFTDANDDSSCACRGVGNGKKLPTHMFVPPKVHPKLAQGFHVPSHAQLSPGLHLGSHPIHPKLSPGLHLGSQPHLARGFGAGPRLASAQALSPGLTALARHPIQPGLASPSPGGGYDGGGGGEDTDGGSYSYGYDEPGASDYDEGAASEPGTYGDDPDQDERSEAASDDEREGDSADWAAE